MMFFINKITEYKHGLLTERTCRLQCHRKDVGSPSYSRPLVKPTLSFFITLNNQPNYDFVTRVRICFDYSRLSCISNIHMYIDDIMRCFAFVEFRNWLQSNITLSGVLRLFTCITQENGWRLKGRYQWNTMKSRLLVSSNWRRCQFREKRSFICSTYYMMLVLNIQLRNYYSLYYFVIHASNYIHK